MGGVDNHPPCLCGCGELADECGGPTPRPLGSIRTAHAIRLEFRGTGSRVYTGPWQAVCPCGWQSRWGNREVVDYLGDQHCEAAG